jgi:hypothetical protein
MGNGIDVSRTIGFLLALEVRDGPVELGAGDAAGIEGSTQHHEPTRVVVLGGIDSWPGVVSEMLRGRVPIHGELTVQRREPREETSAVQRNGRSRPDVEFTDHRPAWTGP